MEIHIICEAPLRGRSKANFGGGVGRREAGESLAAIGRSYNVSHSTISRL